MFIMLIINKDMVVEGCIRQTGLEPLDHTELLRVAVLGVVVSHNNDNNNNNNNNNNNHNNNDNKKNKNKVPSTFV